MEKTGTWEKPLVQMKKHWFSDTGDYLFMYSNIYNPHGYYCLDYDSENPNCVSFEGSQQGSEIYFKGFNPESWYRPIMEFKGKLNGQTNQLSGRWKELTENGRPEKMVVFKPMNSLKPINYSLKVYTSRIEYTDYLTKIKVEFENGKTQILDGFVAETIGDRDIFLEDFNFDGYQDMYIYYQIDYNGNRDEFCIFWFYNPKTKLFEPSEFLNKRKVFMYEVNAADKTFEVSDKNQGDLSKFYYVKISGGKAVGLEPR